MIRKRIAAIENGKAVNRIIEPGIGAVDLGIKRLHDLPRRRQPQEDVPTNPSGEYAFYRDPKDSSQVTDSTLSSGS